MTQNMLVELNHVIGYHLLTFIDGIDAINFIEAVNESKQFSSIAKTLDYHFIEEIKKFRDHPRILLSLTTFERNFNDEEIDSEQLIHVSRRYSFYIQPFERLHIYPCFSTEGFLKLCSVYRTSLFKCYSRLLPFNNVRYAADFCLFNYELYVHSIGLRRMLNDHEKKLFHVNSYFHTKANRNCRSNLSFVRTVHEFKENFASRFLSSTWLEAIDFSKWAIVGGCVLNFLCRLPFLETKEQDVNLILYGEETDDFESLVQAIVSTLNIKIAANTTDVIERKRIPGTLCYSVLLPCNITLKFSHFMEHSKYSLSHILHNFDMDITQVAFVGDTIVCTFPFFEALATKSFILYTLHAEIPRHIYVRIEKYCNRGFNFLEPNAFDGNFASLMQQEETPLHRIEYYQYIDENDEVRFVTKEYYRLYNYNMDTYQLQEKFMNMTCPLLLKFK